MKKGNNQTVDNCNALEREFDWFTTVLEAKLNHYFNEEHEVADILTPPDLKDDKSQYAQMVKQYGFGIDERLVLCLALAPHMQPKMLDILFTANPQLNRPFTEFGGYTRKDQIGFLPTGETAAFLINPEILGRVNLRKMFGAQHPFAVDNMLYLERTGLNEPFLNGRLMMNEAFLYQLTTGENYIPEVTDLFPAKRITPKLEWKDLIVSPSVMAQLVEIKNWIEYSDQLMEDPVYGKLVKPGFRSLFYGPRGTGKATAVSLIGKECNLDVYRIDLSLIVSKYIGDTENNLTNIFKYAESKNWILFFDEADALFGKRTEINSKNDRFANQEMAFLLQRMEDFSGIVILASNLKSSIDEAFIRRFQSTIHFPMPDRRERLLLWQNIFKGRIKPAPDVDFDQLADKYELSGGSIINILQCSTLKTMRKKKQEIGQKDIINCIRKEYQKIGKTL